MIQWTMHQRGCKGGCIAPDILHQVLSRIDTTHTQFYYATTQSANRSFFQYRSSRFIERAPQHSFIDQFYTASIIFQCQRLLDLRRSLGNLRNVDCHVIRRFIRSILQFTAQRSEFCTKNLFRCIPKAQQYKALLYASRAANSA